MFGAPGGERIAVEIHDLTIADGGHGNGGAVGVLGAGSGTLTDATILHNLARGGRGGRAATGGNGQGGGNQGEGLGGGIFNSPGGTLEIDAESLDATFFNHASDHDFQNIFGDLTEIQALPVERKLTVAASEPNGIAQRSPGQARVRHHCRRRRWLRRSFACPAPNRQHHA